MRGAISPRTLSVIIPAYNERESIPAIVKRALEVRLPLSIEIILVDDGSTDGTEELTEWLTELGVRLFKHEQNVGKGAAIQTGLREASGDLILIQDADEEYDPEDWPTLLAPILTGEADVVFGSRFLGGGKFTLWQRYGNKFLTWVANLLLGARLTDLNTCYKMFPRSAVSDVVLKASGFDIDPELLGLFLRQGLHIVEVPISYTARPYQKGKKLHWFHGFGHLARLLRARYARH